MVWIEIAVVAGVVSILTVTTFAVVWIEMVNACFALSPPAVTTFAVVWIEITGSHPVIKTQ